MEILLTIVAFILIFGLLIFVHELGHFWVARRNGIKVEEFAFGLPLLPKIGSYKRGETTYSIYPVPLGGFVRMLGEDGHSRSPRSFARAARGVRAKVLVAGVAMNFLLALVLLTIGFFFRMQPVALCASDYPNATFQNNVTLVSVSKDGSAAAAGIKQGDVLRQVEGQAVPCQIAVPRLLQARAGQSTTLNLERDGNPLSVTVTPKPKGDPAAGRIGVAPKDNYVALSYPRWEAPYLASIESVAIVKATVVAIGGVFVDLLTKASVPEGVAGPVGIAKLTGDIIGLGPIVVLRFIAIISLSLAVFNLLPIPALDGGRLLFVGIEALRGGRPVTPQLENTIHGVGFALLIALIIVITYFDLTR